MSLNPCEKNVGIPCGTHGNPGGILGGIGRIPCWIGGIPGWEVGILGGIGWIPCMLVEILGRKVGILVDQSKHILSKLFYNNYWPICWLFDVNLLESIEIS